LSAFADYSRYYAAFYRDKDYAAEAAFVLGSLRANGFGGGPDGPIVELGCGQGGHAVPLAQSGVSVIGVDRSPGMIEAANRARAALPGPVSSRLRFAVGDIRTWKADLKAGAVISLFHVMSYLPTDADLRATFENARAHLDRGAPFAFDFWFGDAVLRDEPATRRREVEVEGARVARTATPTIDRARHTVDVSYHFDVTPSDGSAPFSFDETHTMRYLFAAELEALCKASGFKPVVLSEWMQAPSAPPQSWNGYFLARAA
jgi:SAM-dependent methyltransferase